MGNFFLITQAENNWGPNKMLDKRIRVLSNAHVEFNNHTLEQYLGLRVQVYCKYDFSSPSYLVALRNGKIVLNDDPTDVSTLNDTTISFSDIKYFSFGAEVAISDNGTIYKV